jgi:tetratricopeptide (TPR) repeat protein
MIRRDYFIRLIEAFGQEMARIESLKGEKKWDEAGGALDEQVKQMIGMDSAAALKLSETELLALLIQGETAQFVRERAWLLTTLLREAGEVAAAQDRLDEANAYYLKALHLLLRVLHQEDVFEFPEFVPRVEALVDSIDGPLPIETEALLMEHYETTGQFARAEDALDKIIASDPNGRDTLDFALGFYERMQNQKDERLLVGNLPRAEVEAGLAELKKRMPQT